jgi:hypothetical protein
VSPRLTALGALAAVTVLGAVVRAIPVAVSDFPVNDGGLFLAMTHAIRDAGWVLPATVAWNGDVLPFAYPPLAFYATGLLEGLGLDPFDVFRWLPLVASVVVIPGVYLLGRDLLRSELAGLVAAVAYALTPVSFVWLIQGGGITRAPGMLLAVLTLWQVIGLVREPSRNRVVATGALAGLTAVTHPGAAVFTATSAVLIGLFEGRTRTAALAAASALVVALLVAAPWLVAISARGQLGDLLTVPSNGPDPTAALLAVFAGRVTGAPFIDPLAIIGLAFAILSLIRRRFLLPLWFGIGALLSYQYAMLPFGLLIGAAAMDLAAIRKREAAPRVVPLVGAAVLAAALIVEGLAGATTILQPNAPVHALDANRRAAMDWVAAELPADVRIAVITGGEWSGDPDSEWFPELTDAHSVATVQGSEWLGAPALNERVATYRALQACVGSASLSCVEDWLVDHPADYLYLPKGHLNGPSSSDDCCEELRAALLASDRFGTQLDSPGATVLSVNRR